MGEREEGKVKKGRWIQSKVKGKHTISPIKQRERHTTLDNDVSNSKKQKTETSVFTSSRSNDYAAVKQNETKLQ